MLKHDMHVLWMRPSLLRPDIVITIMIITQSKHLLYVLAFSVLKHTDARNLQPFSIYKLMTRSRENGAGELYGKMESKITKFLCRQRKYSSSYLMSCLGNTSKVLG